MILTDNEKWNAILQCDETYDGKFFYGVKTTGIFCRPSCKSKAPLRENIEFFDDTEGAYAYGLRPCKRCRPDLLQYNPMMELLDQAKNIYNTYFYDSNELSLEIKQLNISHNHLIRMFNKEFGITPVKYLNKLRIEKASELLLNKDMNILNIAMLCGFGSLSNFYTCFKNELGLTPNEFRKIQL